MQTIELLVSLKIPDVTALTAGSAIRRRLGYEEALKELKRCSGTQFDPQLAEVFLSVMNTTELIPGEKR